MLTFTKVEMLPSRGWILRIWWGLEPLNYFRTFRARLFRANCLKDRLTRTFFQTTTWARMGHRAQISIILVSGWQELQLLSITLIWSTTITRAKTLLTWMKLWKSQQEREKLWRKSSGNGVPNLRVELLLANRVVIFCNRIKKMTTTVLVPMLERKNNMKLPRSKERVKNCSEDKSCESKALRMVFMIQLVCAWFSLRPLRRGVKRRGILRSWKCAPP